MVSVSVKNGFKDESVAASCSSVAIVTVRKQMFSADGGLWPSIHFTTDSLFNDSKVGAVGLRTDKILIFGRYELVVAY